MSVPRNVILDDVKAFVLVARHSSFVEASRRASIPTSTVSRAIARLEDQLGVSLLRRTTRKVAVTDEGRNLLLHVAPHLDGLEEALATTADQSIEVSGLVRVSAPAYTGATRVARALADFALAHPKITIELDPTNTIRDLIEDGYDFAVRIGPLVDADFVARRLWKSPFGLFATRALARETVGPRMVVKRETLERGPCVVSRASATWRFRDEGGHATEIAPGARFAVNDPRAAVDIAERGLGFVLAPIDAVTATKLLSLKTDFGAPESRELYVVYPTRRLLPQRVRMAIAWLSDPRYAPQGA